MADPAPPGKAHTERPVEGRTGRQVMALLVGLALLIEVVLFFALPWYSDILLRLWPGLGTSEDAGAYWEGAVLAFTFAVSLPLAALGGWWMSQRMSRPLMDVARAIRAVAGGDLSARADPRIAGLRETERLVRDFNEMAERLERAETDLRYASSAVAHELRTPLTILRGRLQGLSDGVFEPTPELLGLLLGQVDALVRLVEDLRILALFNADRLDLRPEPVEAAAILREVADLLRTDLAAAGMTLTLELAPLRLEADPARLRQAATALVQNALRYAPGAPLRLALRREGDMAALSVEDRGPGLPEEQMGRIFEPFWRADASRSRAKGGSGLGLSVVRAIAAAHGGAVAARRSAGGGLTVTIRLPMG